jgi:hypothetical protein
MSHVNTDSSADVRAFLPEYNARPWNQIEASQTITPQGVYTATPGVKVEIAYATAPAKPGAADARALWEKRWGKRATGVLLVIAYPGGNGTVAATVVGLRDTPTVVTGLRLDQVERLVDQTLDALSTTAAETLLAPLFEERAEDEVPGFANTGLFATHELLKNVPNRPDWADAGECARSFRGHRGEDLVRVLGWELSHHGIDVLLMKDGQGEAVAVFLEGTELFDRPTTRFGTVSPVQHAIAAARNARVRWVLAVQGTRVRLYTADPDTGIARKGSDSYTEIDLATVEDDHLGYVTLLLTPNALREGGIADEILSRSMDHAAALGERLRDRVYVDVVPDLATAVAERLKATTEAELRDAYHITLVVLFRLLFVAYAEDRGLLPYRTNDAYTHASLKGRARAFADVVKAGTPLEFDPVATDVWDNLTHIWAGIYNGHREWGIPAYGGSLFDPADLIGVTITNLSLTNAEIGPALVKLLVDTGRDATYGPVDFQTLSVREFGTIYEGLLESSLSIAPSDLTLDKKGTYIPAKEGNTVEVYAGGVYFHNASGQRKATGSYFTKQFAVEHLLETALDPTVDEHLDRVARLLDAGDEAGAHETFWDFRVADISMGSGHFLVGAVDHIASAFTTFLTQRPIPGVMAELERLRTIAFDKLTESRVEPLPAIDQMMLVRRQVAKRCLYGVDINSVAVDLARLALWIHTFVPGLPMSSLDHGLVHGNSLTGIGTLHEAFNVFEPEGGGTRSFLADDLEEMLAESAAALRRVGLTAEATAAETKEAERAYADARQHSDPARSIFDAAVAGRLGVINVNGMLETDGIVEAGRRPAVQAAVDEVQALHFPYAFPEVFAGRVESERGFHVILGNPPWEEPIEEENKFWAMHFPGLGRLPSAEQTNRIASLRVERPDLKDAYERRRDRASSVRAVLSTGQFPGMGTGDPDLYKAFIWQFWRLLRPSGRCGVVLPRSVLVTLGSAPWRLEALRYSSSDLVILYNEKEWAFTDVNPGWPVVLMTLQAEHRQFAQMTLRGPFRSLDEFTAGRKHSTSLPVDMLHRSDEMLCIPSVESPAGLELLKALLRAPALGVPRPDFRVRPTTEIHATNDGKKKAMFTGKPSDHPVYNHLNIGHFVFNPEDGPFNYGRFQQIAEELQRRRVATYKRASSPFHGMAPSVASDLATHPVNNPRIAFRDVVHRSNPRKVWACVLPARTLVTNTAPYLVFSQGSPLTQAYVLGILGSSTCDWYGHLKINLHLNYFILNAIPVPLFDSDDPKSERLARLAAWLTVRDHIDGYGVWSELADSVSVASTEEAFAELDALASLIYGVEDEHLELIFDRESRSDLQAVCRWRTAWTKR